MRFAMVLLLTTRIIQSGSDALVTRALAGCVGVVAVSQSLGQRGSGAAGSAREAHADRICTRG